MTDDARFQTSVQDGVTVVRLGEEYSSLYENSLTELAELKTLSESADPPHVVLDLPHTKYFGSAFIGFLMTLSKSLAERSGRLAVSSPTSFARMALESTKSDLLLDLFDSADEAVAAFQG